MITGTRIGALSSEFSCAVCSWGGVCLPEFKMRTTLTQECLVEKDSNDNLYWGEEVIEDEN